MVQAVNEGPLAAAATVLLPASPHAEADGTFVNFEGRPQRFEAAWFPRGDGPAAPRPGARRWPGRPAWSWPGGPPARSGWPSRRAIPGAAVWDFKWDSLPSAGRRRGFQPLPAGTVDGRLAGQKERLAPDTEGGPCAAARPAAW